MERLRRIFFAMYPTEKRQPKNEFGRALRRTILICVIFHAIYFTISLAFIGFLPMIADLFLGCYAYSVYLTL